ncbi:unnamed protein product [Mytilus coruscus]|uniref:DUF3504 domain-containing protein n=1 Tax=Mytilus coruscus TaxID=42192 RepID=A0A6J8ELS2_MYTCO|nr:unnamed protein product [Mytilus coruscus]
MGLGTFDHYPSVNENDLIKLYSSIYCSPNTSSGLYTKVQIYIRRYFFRRGQETMYLMTKTTFGVEIDPATELKVVRKIEDKMTKNHLETDKEESSGIMSEVKRVDNIEKIKMGQTLSDNLVKKSNTTPALPSTAVLALPTPEPASCNQLALPSTKSSANVLQFQPTVQIVNENIQRDGGQIDFLT